MTIHHIQADQTCNRCRPEELGFEATAELQQATRIIGQERALEALDFGINIRRPGFNLFVLGPEGSGRHSFIRSFITSRAQTEPSPGDWCYVENFSEPHRPLALAFPPGMGPVFKREMHELIDTLKTTLPAVFEGDAYRSQKSRINSQLQQQIERLYGEVEQRAKEERVAVVKTEEGILFTAMDEQDKPMNLKEFLKLDQERRKHFEHLIEKYQEELHQAIHQISSLKRKAEEEGRALKKRTAGTSVAPLLRTLITKYQGNAPVLAYLNEVESQIVEGVNSFLQRPSKEGASIIPFAAGPPSFDQYEVNTLVCQEQQEAPVVYEDLPSYQNLHGRIEHRAAMGVLSTHFSLIKPGALHRANGGYLILDADRLLRQPFAYEGLKRTLRSGQIRIEPVERLLGLMSTVSLEPEPIPLNIKVILVGDPWIYYLLHHYDPEFQALFKVQADFEESMGRKDGRSALFGAMIGTIARDQDLLPLHSTAVARVIDEAGRRAGDRDKLSLRIRGLADLIEEADYLARKRDSELIRDRDIDAALHAARRRAGRIRDRLAESVDLNICKIETSGSRIGQVNGLSVIDLGNDSFGTPTRITATVRPGEGEIVDIEREVELGGPIHSKGVMILSAFLGARYARTMPLSLHASLVFEQSYSGVEGDSASCAELCALLSALAQVPLRQELAITGSISQLGEVQAIGGINEKVEAFYDLCVRRGLRGGEGVILPASNIRHLMLKQEVTEAVTAGSFALYGVEQVDEALALLTGQTAGERDEAGCYPPGTVNGRAEEALRRFAVDLQEFKKSCEPGSDDPGAEGA